MTMEQVVTQKQQELFTARAQVAAESGLADAVRAINNLATAQVRKDTPSLIDVKGLGRPKEFTGREEDFQKLSKKTEAFFAGVIKESEMILEWAAEQPTEITTTAIDLEFLPTDTWSLCCSRCTQHSWLSRVMRQMTLSPTRGRIRGRHGGDCRSDMIRRQEEGNETFCARSFLLDGGCSLMELQSGIERRESHASSHEKKIKDMLDDEIKLAGLESLVPEELEEHLILNSNRLRTFEDARLEVVTYVEAGFGLRTRDSKPSDKGARGHSDLMDVDADNSLSSGKGKGSLSPRGGCFECGGAHFQRDCKCTQEHRQAIVWQGQAEQVMVQE